MPKTVLPFRHVPQGRLLFRQPPLTPGTPDPPSSPADLAGDRGMLIAARGQGAIEPVMLLTLRQAARYLGVAEDALEKWAERGELPASRVNDQYSFHRVDLLEWAAERHLTVAPEILADAGVRSERMPLLSECVRAGGIHDAVPGSSKEVLLRRVVDLLPLPPRVDRAFLLEMLLARERLGSTGLGNGIAIPHPREPLVLQVTRPAVSVCYLDHPIDFDAIDRHPVHTLFVIVAPSVRMHLHVLSALGAALHDPAIPPLLEARAPREELLAALERIEAAQARARDERVAGSDQA
jgi:PTS system nitrogen regulatory IIA component